MILKKVLKKIFSDNLSKYLNAKYALIKNFQNGFPYRKYTKKYKCIFIHIPKTAGTSILTCLMGERVYRDHANYYDFKRIDLLRFEKYFKFCFVRNPYDRSVSFYEYLKKGGNGNEDLYFQKLIEDKFNTYEKFVLEYLDKNNIHEHVLFRPQYSFIYDYKNECQVDFIGKYENLKTDFNTICNQIGVSFQLPSKNRIKRECYEGYYTNILVKKKILDLYNKDFELLNYSTIL